MLTSSPATPLDVQSWRELPSDVLIALAERVDELIAEQRVSRLAHATGGTMNTECDCGRGRSIDTNPRGRPRRFATPACRAAAYRRRLAGAPEDTPRRKSQGRRLVLAPEVIPS